MAQHRHKRETNARLPRPALLAAPLAVVATLSAVTMGVLSADPPGTTSDTDLLTSADTSISAGTLMDRRAVTVSRSQLRSAAKAEAEARREIARDEARKKRERRERRERAEAAQRRELEARATLRAVRSAEVRLWTTAALNLWDGPGTDATRVSVLEEGQRVLVTGRREAGRAEVVIDGVAHWASADYLSDEKPEPAEPGTSLGGQCTNGTTAGGAGPNIVKVHAVVCANWPSITTYGTLRGGGGDHPLGKAVDIMISGAEGWDVANFVRANASSLGVSYVIYSQRIWSVQRSGEGWRSMEDRGSITANHYDHVHVSTY